MTATAAVTSIHERMAAVTILAGRVTVPARNIMPCANAVLTKSMVHRDCSGYQAMPSGSLRMRSWNPGTARPIAVVQPLFLPTVLAVASSV